MSSKKKTGAFVLQTNNTYFNNLRNVGLWMDGDFLTKHGGIKLINEQTLWEAEGVRFEMLQFINPLLRTAPKIAWTNVKLDLTLNDDIGDNSLYHVIRKFLYYAKANPSKDTKNLDEYIIRKCKSFDTYVQYEVQRAGFSDKVDKSKLFYKAHLANIPFVQTFRRSKGYEEMVVYVLGVEQGLEKDVGLAANLYAEIDRKIRVEIKNIHAWIRQNCSDSFKTYLALRVGNNVYSNRDMINKLIQLKEPLIKQMQRNAMQKWRSKVYHQRNAATNKQISNVLIEGGKTCWNTSYFNLEELRAFVYLRLSQLFNRGERTIAESLVRPYLQPVDHVSNLGIKEPTPGRVFPYDGKYSDLRTNEARKRYLKNRILPRLNITELCTLYNRLEYSPLRPSPMQTSSLSSYSDLDGLSTELNSMSVSREERSTRTRATPFSIDSM